MRVATEDVAFALLDTGLHRYYFMDQFRYEASAGESRPIGKGSGSCILMRGIVLVHVRLIEPGL